MMFLEESVQDAADKVVADLQRHGGVGGVIALDLEGNGEAFWLKVTNITQRRPAAFSLNCTGMYRGVIRCDGIPLTAIFQEDPLE